MTDVTRVPHGTIDKILASNPGLTPAALAAINRGIADIEAGRTVSSDRIFEGE